MHNSPFSNHHSLQRVSPSLGGGTREALVHNQDMEERVLSELLSHNEWIETGGDYLCRELFYDKRHQTVYDAIRQLYPRRSPAQRQADAKRHLYQQRT